MRPVAACVILAGAALPFAALAIEPFQMNKYDEKLERAHNRYQHMPPPDLMVRTAQTCLEYLGFNPKGVDGIFGNASQSALIRYQKSRELEPDGKLDEAILNRLTGEAFP